jgi:hypothetical protein
MPKYRKRPVVVEAEQWFPGRHVAGVEFEVSLHAIDIVADGGTATSQTYGRHYVTTIHGQRAYLRPGNWVIKESDGVHSYPCDAAEFERIYEPAD